MATKYLTISRVRVPEWSNTIGTLKAGRVYDVTAFYGESVQLSYNGEPIRRGDGRVASIRLDGDIYTGGEPLEVVVGEAYTGCWDSIGCRGTREYKAEVPKDTLVGAMIQGVATKRRKPLRFYVPGLLAAAVVIGLPIVLGAYWLYFISWIPGLAVSILLDEWVDDAAPIRREFRTYKTEKR